MKRSILIIVVCLAVIFYACGNIPSKGGPYVVPATEVVDGISTSSFKVWGNCGMCKSTIETALKTNGVKEADWNTDTKIITVSYDSTVITLDEIHRKVAASGYDTQSYKSSDSTYSNLHECCQYDRK